MNKNIKRMFFVLTLVTLLATVGAVCAADNLDDTNIITDTPSDVTSNVVSEQNSNSDNNIVNTENNYKKETSSRGATSSITTTNTISVTNTNQLTSINDDTTYDIQTDLNLGTITACNLNNVIITSTTGAELTNSAFVLCGTNLQISYLTFKNTNFGNPITITDSTNVIINNNTINNRDENYEDTFGINVATSDYVTITGNKVNVSSCPQGMNWFGPGYLYGAPTVSGIMINNTNNTDVTYNNVTVNSTALTAAYTYSTFDGIVVINNSQNDNIEYNNVSVNGSEYIYGISLSYYVDSININYNAIKVNGSNHVAGIQASSTTNSKIKGNDILGNCTATSGTTASAEAFAYGIILSTELYQSSVCESYYNEIKDNTINLNSTIAYGIELNNADYNNITSNTVNVYGNVVMDLGIYNSSYINVTNNHFYASGDTITLNPYIYEAIYPVTTGIKINHTSDHIFIKNNDDITVNDASGVTSYAVILEDCDDSEVKNNNLLVNSHTTTPQDYDDLVLNNGSNNYIYNP